MTSVVAPCLSARFGRVQVQFYSLVTLDVLTKTSDADALVIEDDTYHVLAADPMFTEPREHPIRIHTAALDVQPSHQGAVYYRDGNPPSLCAVVHDLSCEPTTAAGYVEKAWTTIFSECGRRGLRSLVGPLLGTQHGILPPAKALRALECAGNRAPKEQVLDLWVLPHSLSLLESFEEPT